LLDMRLTQGVAALAAEQSLLRTGGKRVAVSRAGSGGEGTEQFLFGVGAQEENT